VDEGRRRQMLASKPLAASDSNTVSFFAAAEFAG
jgi:hypothetical protein